MPPKQRVKLLRCVGDVNEQSRVEIDMDAVIFSSDTMDGLLHALMVRRII